MKILGIEFAPLLTPLERRLQTSAVFIYCVIFMFFGTTMSLINLYLAFTPYFYIPLLYLLWFIYDRNQCCQGGRRFEWFRRMRIWNYFADYFPVTMIKTADLDPSKNYIFGYHPHGILCYGAVVCFGSEARDFSKRFPGITPRILTLEEQFLLPFHREYIMCSGVCSASRESIEWNLTREGKGNALVLIIGGATEMLNARPGTVTLTIKRRKGFVKLALKHGASLVPVFAFGENEIFEQVQNPHGSLLRVIQDKIKTWFRLPTPVIRGRGVFQYTFGFLPFRKPIRVIIGKPIDVKQTPEPTNDEIDQLHQLYINKLCDLYNEHKTNYCPNIELVLT